MITTAILVDGAFYQKRARYLFGDKNPSDRAKELIDYCYRHINITKKKGIPCDPREERTLYRIFYYDCLPSEKTVYHPLTQKSVDLKKTDLYAWSVSFFEELKKKRKVAIRRGELLESSAGYVLKSGGGSPLYKLCRGEITVADLCEDDFMLDVQQKGVDMKIGLDIASLAHKKQVNQIVLIAGDSDFVPAAKHARREGIDFILDPMWSPIKDALYEHIDGLSTPTSKPGTAKHPDPLCVKAPNKAP